MLVMLRTRFWLLLLVAVVFILPGRVAVAAENAKASAGPAFKFVDVGKDRGLLPAIAGIRGHAAGWGDVDGDGWLDLYVATFAEEGSKKNQLLRNIEGKFRVDEQASTQIPTRATGTLFVDLDNDGDADLYVSSMPKPKSELLGCRLFRNDGGGKFTDISQDNGACPVAFGGRSAAAVDYDGDGLLDLLVGEEPNRGYNGSQTNSSRLFRNVGKLQFEDVTESVGIPANPGLGVAAGDVNNDGWPDLFLAAPKGNCVLLLNNKQGKFSEVAGSRELFAYEGSGGDNMICGVALGDVNRDGKLDIVLGPHFKQPWMSPVPVKLFLNRSEKNGQPTFEDVTTAAGLKPLPMKAPHVEIQDMDNDGWPDITVSIAKFADGATHPLIYRNLGVGKEVRFEETALGVNDFPTAEDTAIKNSGVMFKKVLQDKKIAYTAPGPTADFDNDGKLDMLLVSWWPEADSMLLRNETPSGNWLQVQLEGADKVNRMGIGARVHVYQAGGLGQNEALLGAREIAVGYGYASGQAPIAHLGLGDATSVDVEIVLPHNRGTVVRKAVKANARTKIKLADEEIVSKP